MAIQRVRDRLLRATAALESQQVPYAVVGGNAVAEWIGRIDPGAIRFTPDVDLLLRRDDLPRAIAAMELAGFAYRSSFDVPLFLDNPAAGPRDAVHVVFGGERVKPDDALAAPDVLESVSGEAFTVVTLAALVRMKLTSYRLKDRVHLLDLLSVGLVDASWLPSLPECLASRLRELLDNPE